MRHAILGLCSSGLATAAFWFATLEFCLSSGYMTKSSPLLHKVGSTEHVYPDVLRKPQKRLWPNKSEKLSEWKGESRGRGIWIHTADSCCCAAEMKTARKAIYSSNKIKNHPKDYTPFTVVIKYWLYSLCCIIYPCTLFYA